MTATVKVLKSDRGMVAGASGPLTILHVAAPARVGGLERVVVALADGQRSAGHHVHVAAILSEEEQDHPVVRELRACGVSVHAPAITSRAYGRERAFIHKLCGETHPSVVHTHGYRPDVVDGGVARKLGIPTVSTVHGFTRSRGRGQIYEWLQRRSLKHFDAVVCVSRAQVTELQKFGVRSERLHLMPNAWNARTILLPAREARSQLNVPADAFHIGFVGRLTREKGADVLIDALLHLRDVPLVVSFIGAGSEQPRLEATARRIGASDKIRWHGLLPDASRLLPALDAFVMSSRTEGTPIALFEAIAACVPVVATAVGGVPDVVSRAEALLVPSESPEALAAAIRDVYTDRVGARARAVAARERVARVYAPEPWLAGYETLYRHLHAHRNKVPAS